MVKSIDKMTVADLKSFLDENSVEYDAKARKPDLLELAQGVEVEEGEEDEPEAFEESEEEEETPKKVTKKGKSKAPAKPAKGKAGKGKSKGKSKASKAKAGKGKSKAGKSKTPKAKGKKKLSDDEEREEEEEVEEEGEDIEEDVEEDVEASLEDKPEFSVPSDKYNVSALDIWQAWNFYNYKDTESKTMWKNIFAELKKRSKPVGNSKPSPKTPPSKAKAGSKPKAGSSKAKAGKTPAKAKLEHVEPTWDESLKVWRDEDGFVWDNGTASVYAKVNADEEIVPLEEEDVESLSSILRRIYHISQELDNIPTEEEIEELNSKNRESDAPAKEDNEEEPTEEEEGPEEGGDDGETVVKKSKKGKEEVDDTDTVEEEIEETSDKTDVTKEQFEKYIKARSELPEDERSDFTAIATKAKMDEEIAQTIAASLAALQDKYKDVVTKYNKKTQPAPKGMGTKPAPAAAKRKLLRGDDE